MHSRPALLFLLPLALSGCNKLLTKQAGDAPPSVPSIELLVPASARHIGAAMPVQLSVAVPQAEAGSPGQAACVALGGGPGTPLGRDFRKVAPKYALQRLELFIALDPKSLDQSLIIGSAFNLVPGLDFLVGWRALNKTTEIQPGAGLRPGSPFDGAAGSLPTAQVWSTGGLFLGFGVTNALLAKLH